MRSLVQDLRYAWRTLSKSPGFTVVAVLTLGLGIGANSTILSWINSTLLNPLPGASDARGLVSLGRGGTSINETAFSYPDFKDLRDRNKSFSGITAFSLKPVSLTGVGKPERIWAAEVSANYFQVLSVQPILGRSFIPEEDQKLGGAPVTVISYRLWQSHFAGRDSVIGQKININHHPYEVVGVAPPLFQGAQTGLRSELWIPLVMDHQIVPGADLFPLREVNWLLLVGRLQPGIGTQPAQEEMSLLLRRIAQQYPDSHHSSNVVTLYPMWRSPLGANGYLYVLLPMLLALAGVVLLLACANVANLLLVRSVARRREIAIRLSLGAGRWRLVRQLLVESLMLALAGGVAAMLLTTWTAGTFARFIPASNLPVSLVVGTDRAVFLAIMLLSVATSVIFGILPALRSSRITPLAVLKEGVGSASGGPEKVRLSSGLAVAQISLSLLLLICAGLFLRSFGNAQRFDPGFKPDNVLLATFELFPAGYSDADGAQFERLLVSKLEAVPGVRSASLATWLPLGFTWSSSNIQPEGYVPQHDESMEIGSAVVGPNYLRTMEIPLISGREFTPQDKEASQPVVVVNQAAAERYWPHQSAIGKRLSTGGGWNYVVGVARNSNYENLNEAPQPFIYLPLYQNYVSSAVIHVRTSGDPLSVASAVEKTVHELDGDLPLFDVATLKSRVDAASTLEKMAGTLTGAFGIIALLLAAVGIYGVIAYTTRQRTREIGIRVALGAQQRNVLRLVLSQGLRLTVTGVVLGLLFSFALTRFLRALLFGVTATDALTFIGVAVLLCVVALAACYIPARRAMKVDPVIALRHE
ncbi:MAG TPA: ABC transporter permease [Candidatus Angelobacter sp.]